MLGVASTEGALDLARDEDEAEGESSSPAPGASTAMITPEGDVTDGLAVGAGDVNDLKLFLRVVRERSQLAWIIQTELGAEQA